MSQGTVQFERGFVTSSVLSTSVGWPWLIKLLDNSDYEIVLSTFIYDRSITYIPKRINYRSRHYFFELSAGFASIKKYSERTIETL